MEAGQQRQDLGHPELVVAVDREVAGDGEVGVVGPGVEREVGGGPVGVAGRRPVDVVGLDLGDLAFVLVDSATLPGRADWARRPGVLGGVGVGLGLEQGVDPGEDPGVGPARRLPLADQLQLGRFQVAQQRQHLDDFQRVVVGDRELAAAAGLAGRDRAALGRRLGRQPRRRGRQPAAVGGGDGADPGPAPHDGHDEHDPGQGRAGNGDEDERQILGEEEPRQEEDRGDDHQEEAHEEHERTALGMAMTTKDGSGGLYPGG